MTPGDPSRLVPNQPDDFGQYIGKSLAIRALVDECGGDATRLAEADALLREAYLERFVAAPDCSNVDVQKGWQHARRIMAVRELFLYGDGIAEDVMAGIRAVPRVSPRRPARWQQREPALERQRSPPVGP